MIINVSGELKRKVINREKISKKEALLFIEYMINKTRLIVDRMYIKDYNYMILFMEISFSYNLYFSFFDGNLSGGILDMGDDEYIVDINFDKAEFKNLYQDKYIKFSEENYLKYLRLCGELSE